MTTNPHFESVATIAEARAKLSFEPREPSFTRGVKASGLRIHVLDHKRRELTVEQRSLEVYYPGFVVTQAWKGRAEARRLALEVSYGREPRSARIGTHDARLYELGPVPPPDDIDGRSPSVVTWSDGDVFFLIASSELPVADLVPIAESMG